MKEIVLYMETKFFHFLFNTHAGIVKYCQERDVLVGCAPFSRLSSVDGPVEQWEA